MGRASIIHRKGQAWVDRLVRRTAPTTRSPNHVEWLETLEICELTYHYPGSENGIEGVNLTLVRGSFVVLAGASGAGKTTLLRVLLGLLPRDAGEIRRNARLLSSPLLSGALVADPHHSITVPRVVYIAQACMGSAEALAGELRRALEADAELIVVDDLSAVLTGPEESVLWDALFCRRLFRRTGACLAVSNRQAALSRADRILVMRDGRVVGAGRLEELLQTCAEMRRILSSP